MSNVEATPEAATEFIESSVCALLLHAVNGTSLEEVKYLIGEIEKDIDQEG